MEGVLFLLSLPMLRNSIKKQSNDIWKKSIVKNKTRTKILFSKLKEIFQFIIVFVSSCFFISIIPSTIFQAVMRFWKLTFIATFSSIIVTWIQEKKESTRKNLQGALFIIGIITTILTFLIDIESVESIEHYKLYLLIPLSIFISILFLLILKKFNKKGEYFSKSLNSIRKDLYYRTTNIDIQNTGSIELSKTCERYFDKYLKHYNKIVYMEKIEFSNLLGKYKNLWYQRVESIVKKMYIISCFILFVRLLFGFEMKIMLNIVIMLTFYINVIFLKNIDKDVLCRIAIIYFYREWGYCLYYKGKCKFVGDIQLNETSKYHKYIHSVLDIAALCRAAVYCDKCNNTEVIKAISNEFYDLFDNYTNDIDSNWIKILPLWIVSLFEFNIHGKLAKEKEVVLRQYCKCKSERHAIDSFLYSFWVDMTSQMPNKKIGIFIHEFMNSLDCEIS
ncbi:hypothetical protein [Sedimentibacter sp.]|uniref:hypothetical protein n=1 Tax=Sedimentibacter sp. TaxID=1960295 RepID=UPI00289726A8|nr:hypothetical protein [Sedimentibacter sp.]